MNVLRVPGTSGLSGTPNCVSVKLGATAATVTICVRVRPVPFACTAYCHVPGPVPLPPEVVEAQAGRPVTVH